MSRRSVKTKPSVLLPPIEPSPYDVSGVIYAIFNELPFTVDTADTALVKLGDTTHKEQVSNQNFISTYSFFIACR